MSQAGSRKQGSQRGAKKPSTKTLTKQPQSEEDRLARERQIVDALNRQQIHKYLMNLEPNTASDLVAGRVIGNSSTSVERQVLYGVINLPDAPLPIPEPYQPPARLSYQLQREQELKNKRENIQKKNQYLNDQLRGDREQSKDKPRLSIQVKEILSKEEHEQKVKQMQGEWAEMRRRHDEAAEEAARRKKQAEDREDEMRVLEQQKQTEKKRAAIEESIRKRKAQHQNLLNIEKQLQKKFESLRGKERLYQKMEHKYQSEVMLPFLEEKKNKLKQLRQFHKNYDIDAVRQHEKKYIILHEKQKLKEREKERVKEKLKDKSKEKSDGEATEEPGVQAYQPPSRSEKMNRLLAEEAQALKRQLQSKKMQNEQMQRRLQDFEREVLSKHKPRVDQAKKQEILQRYKEEDKKNQRASIDIKRVGDNYLEIAKKMRRSESHRKDVKTDKDEKEDEAKARIDQNSLLLSRSRNRSQDFYESIRRRRIQDIINSEENNSREKFHMLKQQTDKLGEKIRQKEELARLGKDDEAQQEAAELILTSIKAKMGIMNVLSNRQDKPGSAQTEE